MEYTNWEKVEILRKWKQNLMYNATLSPIYLHNFSTVGSKFNKYLMVVLKVTYVLEYTKDI